MFNANDFNNGIRQLHWNHVLSDENHTNTWTQITNILLPICDKQATFVNIMVRSTEPPWVTEEVRALCNGRDYVRDNAQKLLTFSFKTTLYVK